MHKIPGSYLAHYIAIFLLYTCLFMCRKIADLLNLDNFNRYENIVKKSRKCIIKRSSPPPKSPHAFTLSFCTKREVHICQIGRPV